MDEETHRVRAIASLANRKWVSLKQLARIIGVSYPTALRMRDRGDVRAIKVGGHFRVYEDELVRFLVHGNYVANETAMTNLLNEELQG